jgi:hypothetical protein
MPKTDKTYVWTIFEDIFLHRSMKSMVDIMLQTIERMNLGGGSCPATP